MVSLRPSIESLRGPPVPVGFEVPAAGGGIGCQGLGIDGLGIRGRRTSIRLERYTARWRHLRDPKCRAQLINRAIAAYWQAAAAQTQK